MEFFKSKENLWNLENIGAYEAQKSSRGKGASIAIIDTGVDYTHPDLADNIWTNEDEIPDNGIDDDDNGYIDDTMGWDYVGESPFFPKSDNDPLDGRALNRRVIILISPENNSNN